MFQLLTADLAHTEFNKYFQSADYDFANQVDYNCVFEKQVPF